MEIGNVIAKLRVSNGLNQREFAKKLEVSNGAVAMWETNKRQPDLEMVKKISNLFDVPTDYILGAGTFQNWDKLIENKEEIIKQISYSLKKMSSIVLSGMDDISFAKFVYAFRIELTDNGDGTFGITSKEPIPNYSNNAFFPQFSTVSTEEEKLLTVYRCLSDEEKTIVYGKALDLKHSSVAADQAERKASGK